MIMEDKSHSLPSTSWRPWKAHDVIPVQIRRSENWRADGISLKSRGPRTGSSGVQEQKMDTPAQAKTEQICPSTFSILASTDWMKHPQTLAINSIGEDSLLYSVC